MKRFNLARNMTVAVLALLTAGAAAQAETLIVEGSGKVSPDFVQVGCSIS
jgi:hypothetical protein